MLRQQVTPDNSERLGGMIEYLEDLAGTALGVATRSARETVIFEIRHIFFQSYLKSTKHVVEVSNYAYLMRFASSQGSGAQDPFEFQKVDRDSFKLDLAFMLACRDANARGCFVRFQWADDSPQGPYDWLLWKEMSVAAKHILIVDRAAVFLMQSRGGVLMDVDGHEIPLDPFQQRRDANKVLSTYIFIHVYAPATMGQGATWAEGKVSTGIHIFSNETWDTSHLFRHTAEVMSFTSDMGTEIKLPDFVVNPGHLERLVPEWLAPREQRAPLQIEDDVDDETRNPFVQCTGNELLKHMFRFLVLTISFILL